MTGAPIAPRAFTDAAALLADAARIRAQCFAPRPTLPVSVPVVVRAPPEDTPVSEAEAAEAAEAKRLAIIGEARIRPPTNVRGMVRLVAAVAGMTPDDIIGRRQFPLPVKARQIACWASWKYLDRSLPRIGGVFGRHHTTVLSNACRVGWVAISLRLPVDEGPVKAIERLWSERWPTVTAEDKTEIKRAVRGLPSLFVCNNIRNIHLPPL